MADRRLVAAALLATLTAVTGCGSSASPTAAVVATRPPAPATIVPTAVPRGELLIAVLERRHGSRTPDTVAIVGLDGYARARATIQPRAVPDVGDAKPVLQPEAHVLGGAVYFVDGLGVVRRLVPRDGPARTVATFPLISDRQSVAFAVSPDGTRLIASVLTAAPIVGVEPGQPGIAWHVDVETASAGGPTTTVRSIDIPTQPGTAPRTLQVVGWDATHPVALPDGRSAEQEDSSGGLWQGHPAHLDSNGLAGPPLGGPDCGLSAEEPDGTLLCSDPEGGTTVLRRPDGSAVHTFAHTGRGAWLSPDGSRLAYAVTGGPAAVQALDGSTVTLAPGFTPAGWLDDGLVVGTTGGGELAYVALTAPRRSVDIGFPGTFVGALRG